MISSVTGQNAYLAHYAAYRRPSVQDNDQDGGWGSTNGASGSSGMGGPNGVGGGVGGGMQPLLSGGMNIALLAPDSTGSPSQVSGQGSDISSTAKPTSSQGGDLSSLLADLESLLSSLIGTTTNSTGTNGTGTTASSSGTSSIDNTGTTSTTDVSSRLMQDLQPLANHFGAAGPASTDVASLSSGPRSPPSGRPPEPPPWNNDVVNTGTATTDAGGGSISVSGMRDNAWQQVMLSAYAWGADRAASSSTTGVTV